MTYRFKYVIIRELNNSIADGLKINNKILVPDCFNQVEGILSNIYNIKKIKIDVISKVDGLSCLSSRW